ncbi:hypothetical protein HMP0721_1745 [Pseudoramibacter alactolyticus ATCC 23263]|uniref:Uncharacterized protein n=1 Tax=Pseudoramibacter alactolyticus ATCC 23263 TaxID=887929 RepID=E6MIB0_9FIRM|nr:hypothetical protein HMP0721_1745 [Pseudoramibacter alactolyticus ATCC 23263]
MRGNGCFQKFPGKWSWKILSGTVKIHQKLFFDIVADNGGRAKAKRRAALHRARAVL